MKGMMQSTLQFFAGVQREFSKVTWPSRQELTGATLVVVLFLIVNAIYLGIVDLCIRSLMGRII